MIEILKNAYCLNIFLNHSLKKIVQHQKSKISHSFVHLLICSIKSLKIDLKNLSYCNSTTVFFFRKCIYYNIIKSFTIL